MLLSKTVGIFFSLTLSLLVVQSAYTGDIVVYWNQKISLAINASSPGLASVQNGWVAACVHTSILLAAENSKKESRTVQQLAVSFAAHDSLTSVFVAQYPFFDFSMKFAEDAIKASEGEAEQGRRIGEAAARRVIKARSADLTKFIRYEYKAPAPGVYQATPPDFPFEPLAPSARFIRPFGGVEKTDIAQPPPDPTKPGYEKFLQQVFEKGVRTGSMRTAYETETAYFFLESMATWWNRFTTTMIGDKFKDNILESAKLFALVNYGIANSGFAAYKTKYTYDAWRPVTAIRFNQTYLANGEQLYDPTWTPLEVTPTHQDYVSGHASYSGGAAGILKRYLGTDKLDPPVTISSNVTRDNVGVITRTYTSVDKAARECGDARVFAGLHFNFSSNEGIKVGDAAAKKVFDNFKRGWRQL